MKMSETKKYHIPEYYNDARRFYNPRLLEYETTRKNIEDESLNYQKMDNTILESIGVKLQTLYETENFMLGIHRTPADEQTIVNTYFNDGLKNIKPEYDNTISTYKYFPTLLHEISKCESGWKNSKGCLLVLIPKEPEIPFYRVVKNEKNQEMYFVLPTFIYGYVGVENGEITKLVKNLNYGKDCFFDEETIPDEYIINKAATDKKLKELGYR